ncbi:MAG: ABC transporter substrate-binding protein [Arthrobacter sp.]|nr:ABC transporter substrate-binding protein [Arthrobacter sp.]
MKTNRKALAALSIFAAGSLALTACGGGSGDSGSSSSSQGGTDSSAAATSAIITTNGTEPQNPLIPTNTTEVGGGKIIDLVFAGLVAFDAKGEPQLDAAESIEPNADNTVWTIKLKAGQKFSDGSAVTSDSFIDAWNYGANIANAQGSSSFFENIKGYSADAKKPVEKLSGLKKVSDTEFTVDLSQPETNFKLRLGYSAFVPLPKAAYGSDGKITKAFGEAPIGNGPYKLASDTAWTHNEGIKLVKSDSYDGIRKAQNGGITITFYTSQDSAYAAVQSKNGTLDILDQVPPASFATYESDFADSNVNQPAAIFQSFTIPQYLDHFKSDTEEGQLRRQAISLSIDRATITDKIFSNTRTPAKDFTSPVLSGWDTWGKNLAGNEVLNFDVTKAKELWAQADAISKYDGDFTIAYNSDGGHKEWVDAVTGMISQNLGIKAEGKAYPAFKGLLDDEKNNKMTGAFRSGWQADYPAIDNFLTPLYSKTGGSNYGRYDSAAFAEGMKAAAAAKTPELAQAEYDKVQQTLLKDLPAIPLWYSNVQSVWDPALKNVQIGWNSVPLYYAITK